jgi:hypothetical protein
MSNEIDYMKYNGNVYILHFNPGVEIVHVIAKHFNPVSRAEFNPGVESAPCNR